MTEIVPRWHCLSGSSLDRTAVRQSFLARPRRAAHRTVPHECSSLHARPSCRSRFEARNTLASVATMAQEQIGLPPSATMMQFVCGAVGLLDPYSSFLSAGELAEVESQIEGNFVGLGIALQPHEVPLRILNVIAVVRPVSQACKLLIESSRSARCAVPMLGPNALPICCAVQRTRKSACW